MAVLACRQVKTHGPSFLAFQCPVHHDRCKLLFLTSDKTTCIFNFDDINDMYEMILFLRLRMSYN